MNTARFVYGNWPHLFVAGIETNTRLVFDREARRIVLMHVQRAAGWQVATDDEIADVQDSFINANQADESPAAYGLVARNRLPRWALESPPDAKPEATPSLRKAFREGRELGLDDLLGGRKTPRENYNRPNPYSSGAAGVAKRQAWRRGYFSAFGLPAPQ